MEDKREGIQEETETKETQVEASTKVDTDVERSVDTGTSGTGNMQEALEIKENGISAKEKTYIILGAVTVGLITILLSIYGIVRLGGDTTAKVDTDQLAAKLSKYVTGQTEEEIQETLDKELTDEQVEILANVFERYQTPVIKEAVLDPENDKVLKFRDENGAEGTIDFSGDRFIGMTDEEADAAIAELKEELQSGIDSTQEELDENEEYIETLSEEDQANFDENGNWIPRRAVTEDGQEGTEIYPGYILIDTDEPTREFDDLDLQVGLSDDAVSSESESSESGEGNN